MALGKIILTLLGTATVVGGGAFLYARHAAPAAGGSAGGGNAGGAGSGNGENAGGPQLGGWEFAEWTTTQVDATTELPTIVVLHDANSGDADARAILAGFESPARVLVPLGRIGSAQTRSYLASGADTATQQKVAVELQSFMFAVLAQRKLKGRLIVVGLGSSGPLAVALGLFAGLAVRVALGIGGTYDPAAVPAAPQQAQVRVRQWIQSILPQAAQDLTIEAYKLMVARGFDAQLYIADFDPPVTSALAKAWLWPELVQAVGQ